MNAAEARAMALSAGVIANAKEDILAKVKEVAPTGLEFVVVKYRHDVSELALEGLGFSVEPLWLGGSLIRWRAE